jgi:hypothetical protein
VCRCLADGRSRSLGTDPGVVDTGEICHLAAPSRDVICAKLAQVIVTARPGHDLHELHGGIEEAADPLRRCVDVDQGS